MTEQLSTNHHNLHKGEEGGHQLLVKGSSSDTGNTFRCPTEKKQNTYHRHLIPSILTVFLK